MPAPAHVQAATIEKFISGWKKWTFEDWTATWSPDCVQKMLPTTLGIPPKSFDEVRAFLPKLMGVLSNYELNVYEIVHDAANSKAVIYATSRADTPFEGGFKWTNEYAVFIYFTEDGTQINKTEEMVDTKFFHDFSPRFHAYMSAKAAAK